MRLLGRRSNSKTNMSYFDESDARRDARRDFDRGRCDRDQYDRHASMFDDRRRAYTEEYDSAKREEERRQERLQEEREQERREEAARERRRHEAEMERQREEEEYNRQQQEAYEQQQTEPQEPPVVESPNDGLEPSSRSKEKNL